MTFNSVVYALFLPVVVAGHWLLPRRARLAWLLAASYVFYGAWDWRFLALLWLSTTVDYTIGRLLDRPDHTAPGDPEPDLHPDHPPADRRQRHRRRLLGVSVVVNLGLLATFKYFDFFVGSAATLLESLGLDGSDPALRLVLPVGISFYTFQSLAYTIDVYRGRIRACRDPILFATFVAFFPQLVAGPIERADHLLPQLAADRHPPRDLQVLTAVQLIALGLAKKVVVGDSLAPVVDQAFSDPTAAGAVGTAAGVVAFALQIYADFSGYTDVARGSARLLGVELTHNFAQPYLSVSVTDFWRRWHISLSRWLRDYLYIPLGGNRRGEGRTRVNLMATMLLGGLWHGASWHFVAWGGLHGTFLVAERRLRHRRDHQHGDHQHGDHQHGDHQHGDHSESRPLDALIAGGAPLTRALGRVAAVAATFVVVCLAWVLFRAPSLEAAGDVYGALVGAGPTAELDGLALVPVFGLALLALDLADRRRTRQGWRPERSPLLAGVVVGASVALLLVFGGRDPVPFVYFQF